MDAVVAGIVLNQGIGEMWRHVVLVVQEGRFVLDLSVRRGSEIFEVIGRSGMASIVVQRVTLTLVSQGCHVGRVCLCYVDSRSVVETNNVCCLTLRFVLV